MTKEEKAKAYDEALEKAKELLDSPRTCFDIEQLKDIFSELAESEDERIRRKMIEHFKSKTKDTWCNMPVKDILAWLEKQKEQKPAEWSEKDEEMLKDIIAEIEATKQYFFTHDSEGRAQMQARIEWLKSLRPSWKPSEVQMSMLLAVINDPHNAGAESCQLAISDLYQDLKKL